MLVHQKHSRYYKAWYIFQHPILSLRTASSWLLDKVPQSPVLTVINLILLCYIFWKTELLVDLYQRHAMLPATQNCLTCGKQCQKERLLVWQDLLSKRTSADQQKRCSYFQLVYKGSWFEKSKLERVLRLFSFMHQKPAQKGWICILLYALI